MARPTREEAGVILQRNKRIIGMIKRGYPSVYIADYFNVSKGTVSKIVSKIKGRKEIKNEQAT